MSGIALRLSALAGVLAISFSAILFRLAGTTPSTAAFFRAAYAVPLLALIHWLAGRDRRSRRDRRLAFAAGLLLALDLTLWHRSIELIGAGLGTVLANTQVVFVGLAAWWLHRERPTGLALLVVPVVLGGVALISGLGRATAYGADPVGGTIFGVLTGIAYTGFLLVFRRSNRDSAGALGPLLDASLGAAAGALLLGLPGGWIDPVPHWPAHGWLLALAWGPQAGGWLLIARALPRLPALETSVLLLLQPVASVIWGMLIFGEWLSALQWAGAGLVVGGVGALLVGGAVRRGA